jgi:hypothetical protein
LLCDARDQISGRHQRFPSLFALHSNRFSTPHPVSISRMMPSAIPPSLSPPGGNAAVAIVPSPAVSPAIVGRTLYEQPMGFRSPSADFEIEHVLSPRMQPRPPMRRAVSDYANESLLQSSIATVIAAKARSFAITGRIPVDPATLTLFFRTKVGGFWVFRSSLS